MDSEVNSSISYRLRMFLFTFMKPSVKVISESLPYETVFVMGNCNALYLYLIH